MKSVFLGVLTCFASSVARAGFGGMGNTDADDSYASESTMSIVFWCVVVGVAAGVAYAKYKNQKGGEQIAPGGCAIVGGFVGFFVLPFVYLLFTK